jgi:hypothetical protein
VRASKHTFHSCRGKSKLRAPLLFDESNKTLTLEMKPFCNENKFS